MIAVGKLVSGLAEQLDEISEKTAESILRQLHDGNVGVADDGGGAGGVVEQGKLTEMLILVAGAVLLDVLAVFLGVKAAFNDEETMVANLALGDDGLAGLESLGLEGIADLTALVLIKGVEDADLLDGGHVLLTMAAVAIDDDVGESVTIQLPGLAVGLGRDVGGTFGVVQQGQFSEDFAGHDALENLLGVIDLDVAFESTGLDDEHEVTVISLGDGLVAGVEGNLLKSEEDGLHLILTKSVEEPARGKELLEALHLLVRLSVNRGSESLLLIELTISLGRDGGTVALVLRVVGLGSKLRLQTGLHFLVIVTLLLFAFVVGAARGGGSVLGHGEDGMTESIVLGLERVNFTAGASALVGEPGRAMVDGIVGHVGQQIRHKVFQHGRDLAHDVLLLVLADVQGLDGALVLLCHVGNVIGLTDSTTRSFYGDAALGLGCSVNHNWKKNCGLESC